MGASCFFAFFSTTGNEKHSESGLNTYVLYSLEQRVPVQEYIFGLGGRDFYPKDAEKVFCSLAEDNYSAKVRYIGLLEREDQNVY